MPDKLWKATERAVARQLGGQRTGPAGRAAADVLTDRLAVEVKTRHQLPAWIEQAVCQAEAAATGGRLPVAVLHQAGERHDKDVCLLRLSALTRILKDGGTR